MTDRIIYTRPPKLEKLMNIDEVTTILGVGKSTLYSWVCQNKIRMVKVGHKNMFKPSDILKFIEKYTKEPIKVG